MTPPDSATTWIPQPTHDGSYTFFSSEFGETFHSLQGARSEAFQKFAIATRLSEKAQRSHLHLLDVCYGLGYNSAAALETIWQINPHCEITLYGLEKDTTVPRGAIAPELIRDWSPTVQSVLQALATTGRSRRSNLQAHLLIGDARQTVQTLDPQSFQAIFFDPFSPRKCPQLWTVEFFQAVARTLAPDGQLATYSRSASVRSAMQLAGLQIGTIALDGPHLPHEWAQGTIAAWDPTGLHPLSPMEQEHLQTRAAIPYRDPTLQDTAAMILERHHQEQGRSSAESTSSWRRRWGIR